MSDLATDVLRDAPIGILLLDPEGRVSHVNPFLEKLLGSTLSELKGTDWCAIHVVAHDRERFRNAIGAQGKPSLPIAVSDRTGREVLVDWDLSPLRDATGQPSGTIAFGRPRPLPEALRDSEATLRTVVSSVPECIKIVDRHCRLVDMNPAGLAIIRARSLEQVRGVSLFDLVAPEYHQLYEDSLSQVLQGGSNRITFEVIALDGQRRWVEQTSVPLFGHTPGSVQEMLAVTHDITDRMRDELRLKQAQALAQVGSWEVDFLTGAHWWSDEIYRILGLDRTAPHSFEAYLQMVHPEDRPRVAANFRRGRQEAASYEIEHRIVTPDGRTKHIRAQVRMLAGPDGVTRRAEGTLQDVTARVAAELRLREAQELAKLGSWELDLTTNALIWSDEIFNIFEIDRARFAASYEAFLSTIHPEDRAKVDATYRASVEERTPYEILHRLLLPDGRIKWVQERGQTHYDSEGHPLRSVGTVQDVTERRALVERLEQSQAIAHIGSWQIDHRTRHSWWSDETYRILGLIPGVLPSSPETFFHSVHPEDRDAVEKTFRLSLKNREAYDLEHRILTPEGSVRHVRAQVRSTFDADGRPRLSEGTIQDVTTQIEDRLRLRKILDSMFAFVAVSDLEGRITEINKAPLDVAGLRKQDVLGQRFWDSYWCAHSAESREQVRRAILQAAAGKFVREDVLIRVSDDEYITLDAAVGPLFDESGRVEAVIASGVDITERKRAQDAARLSTELLRTVVAGAPVAIYALDREGVFRFSEGRVLEKLGLRPGELVGKSSRELYGRVPAFDETRATFEQALSGKEARLTTRVGPIDFESISAPSYDARGQIDGVIGVGFDISDRVEAERTARERESRLSAIFNHASDAMMLFSVSPTGELALVAANKSCYERFAAVRRVSEEEVLGKSFEGVLETVYGRLPPGAQKYRARFRTAIETAAPFTFEHTIPIREGSLTSEVTLAPVLDSAGRCSQILWSSRDITARKQAESQMKASLAEKETLLREIHHRVKNNLQIIASLLHFQEKKALSTDDAVLSDLRRRLASMTLVHERLYRSRDVARVDFAEYVRALVEELARSFKADKNIQIDVQADDLRLPIELAMPGGMIVCELVTNVMKHAFPGDLGGHAAVAVRISGDQVVLSVEDDGVGFPVGFDVMTARSFGWEIVRGLVLQLEGAVEVGTDKGARVRVSFARPAEGAAP